jgi:hypothetical protein
MICIFAVGFDLRTLAVAVRASAETPVTKASPLAVLGCRGGV